jgi:hypothetical protein
MVAEKGNYSFWRLLYGNNKKARCFAACGRWIAAAFFVCGIWIAEAV